MSSHPEAERPYDGLKDDVGKARLGLVPPQALEMVARVRMHGVSRYGDSTWREVAPWRYFDAALRHLVAYMRGEWADPDSGLPHLAHAACNCMLMLEILGRDGDGETVTPAVKRQAI